MAWTTLRRAAAWALAAHVASVEPAGAAELPPILLNTSTVAPFNIDDGSGFLDRLVAEAFRRVGRSGKVVPYPQASARAIMLANDGVDDGVALRILGLDQQFPNLVRVPEKVMDNDFVAYSKGLDLRTESWDSLEPFGVGYILGWVIFEKNVRAAQVTMAKDVPQLFGLLASGRADLVLYERWQGLAQARELGVTVVVHEPPLATVEMFMYLHRKHADLVEPLALALRSIKGDGTYDRLVAETLAPLAAPPAPGGR